MIEGQKQLDSVAYPASCSCVGPQTSAAHRETPWGLRVPLRASLAETAGRTDNQLVASLPEHLSELKHRVDGTRRQHMALK